MTTDNPTGGPPYTTPEQVKGMRRALDAAGVPPDTVPAAGVDDKGRAFIRGRPTRFRFIRHMLGLGPKPF